MFVIADVVVTSGNVVVVVDSLSSSRVVNLYGARRSLFRRPLEDAFIGELPPIRRFLVIEICRQSLFGAGRRW